LPRAGGRGAPRPRPDRGAWAWPVLDSGRTERPAIGPRYASGTSTYSKCRTNKPESRRKAIGPRYASDTSPAFFSLATMCLTAAPRCLPFRRGAILAPRAGRVIGLFCGIPTLGIIGWRNDFAGVLWLYWRPQFVRRTNPSPRAERTQSGAPSEPNLGRSNSLKLYVEKELKLVCRTDPGGRAERAQSGAPSEPKFEGTSRAGRMAWPDLSCARALPRASGKVFVNGISQVLDDVRERSGPGLEGESRAHPITRLWESRSWVARHAAPRWERARSARPRPLRKLCGSVLPSPPHDRVSRARARAGRS